jgi:hypothetical protein
MADKPEALRLADRLEDAESARLHLLPYAADELRRLHKVNQELLEALKLALCAYGVMLMSDPPQEAWKAYGVEKKALAAIAKAEGQK